MHYVNKKYGKPHEKFNWDQYSEESSQLIYFNIVFYMIFTIYDTDFQIKINKVNILNELSKQFRI